MIVNLYQVYKMLNKHAYQTRRVIMMIVENRLSVMSQYRYTDKQNIGLQIYINRKTDDINLNW